MKIWLKVQREEEEEQAKNTQLMKRAGNKSCHKRPEIPMRGYTIKTHICNHTNVTPHKYFVREGFGVLIKIKEG